MIDSTRRKAPTTLDWSRQRFLVKERPGVHEWRIVYFAKVNVYTVVNVWRQGSYWKFVVISTHPRSVLAHGDAPTMHYAKLRAEAALGAEPKPTLWDRKDGKPDDGIPF